MNRKKTRGNENSLRNSSFVIHDSPAPLRRGFTLVELMVSIGIFLVITSIVMVNQHRFGGSIQISNLAYDVALGIRQAQVYGMGQKQYCRDQSIQTTCAFTGFGVHFASQGYFVLFSDVNNDNKYDTNSDTGVSCQPNSECIKFFKVEQGNLITKFCAGSNCTDTISGSKDTLITALDVIFHRPDPEPIITSNPSLIGNQPSASITVTSPDGISKMVTVLSSGQISVQQ